MRAARAALAHLPIRPTRPTGDGFWRNGVISLCIGGCIQELIETSHYGISAWLRRRGNQSEQVRKN